MCRTYDSPTQTQDQGHNSSSCDLPFNLCPLHISLTVWTSFIKLHSNVPLDETVYRAHDPASLTQGHWSGIFFEFGVCSVSPEPWGQFFMKLILNVPLSKTMCKIFELATKT